MNATHSTTQARTEEALRFEVHRSALTEAGTDAAWAAAWLLLWLVFILALAPPTPALGVGRFAGEAGPAGAVSPASQVRTGAGAQPDPGASSRGVAPAVRGGAG